MTQPIIKQTSATRLLLALGLIGAFSGCTHGQHQPSEQSTAPQQSQQTAQQAPQAGAEKAPESTNVTEPRLAVLSPAPNQKVRGTVRFVPQTDGVRVIANIQGLPRNSKHGFHLHEFGDCSHEKFESAGGHFNPAGKPHGGLESEERHAGDFGNITSNDKGVATFDQVVPSPAKGGKDFLGRAVVVHKQADNLSSQPSGDAGARIACGVIGLAKSEN